mmetsp:Transcript_1270/g.2069  ORF Transcript_1270/g.2069 Transcript_1270/m.2069 type:complete len:434 (-) Transcript_1270:94-1395(-)
MSTLLIQILSAIVVGFIGYAGYLFIDSYRRSATPTDDSDIQNENSASNKSRPKPAPKKETKTLIKSSQVNSKLKWTNATNKKDHSLFFKEIGGHTVGSCCVAFSAKGDLVASSSHDGMIRCIPVGDIGSASPHDVYTKVEGIPTAICFTQNAKRIIAAVGGKLKFFSISISDQGKKLDHVKDIDSGLCAISSVHVLDVEQWMVVIACGTGVESKPCVRAFDQKGHVIADFKQEKRKGGRADRNRMSLAQTAVVSASPDDRYIAVYGLGEGVGDGEVGVFEVVREKGSGAATGLRLVFALSGHTSHVVTMAWSVNGKRLVTCCDDSVWRLWDTSVRYNESDQPRLFSGHQTLPEGALPTHVAMMKGGIVAFACGKDLYFCASASGAVLEHISDACVAPVRATSVSADGSLLATVVDNVKRIALWSSPKCIATGN